MLEVPKEIRHWDVMPEGEKLTQGEVVRYTESEIIKTIQNDDDIKKRQTLTICIK
jgi:hypothetical protein